MSNVKSPFRSKINIIAFLGIVLPYVNAYLSETLGWTDAKLRF